jgi:hypothetical protein
MQISREVADPEPSKPTKAPFDGFVGAPPPSIPKYSREKPDEPAANDEVDSGVLRRRLKALADLAEYPERRIAVVAERGDPSHVTVAVRDVAVGDFEIPAESFDGFALLALIRQHGHL